MVAVPLYRNIKLTIAYDGTNYHGWQKQPNVRTIQGTIESALLKILKHPIKLTGASRTDVGVHALNQVANFYSNVVCYNSGIPLKGLHNALNAILPEDIVILNLKEVDMNFSARHSAKWRTYSYTILESLIPDPFLRNTCFHIIQPLKIAKVRESAGFFRQT